nr:immunoglobulin light chain junction region [Macaca mulatta]
CQKYSNSHAVTF